MVYLHCKASPNWVGSNCTIQMQAAIACSGHAAFPTVGIRNHLSTGRKHRMRRGPRRQPAACARKAFARWPISTRLPAGCSLRVGRRGGGQRETRYMKVATRGASGAASLDLGSGGGRGGDGGSGKGLGGGKDGGGGSEDGEGGRADERVGRAAGVFQQLQRGLKDRLEVDPDFVFKVGVECFNDACIILAVNYLQRGKRFFSELEFVICQLACSLLCDMTLVYLLAPLPPASAAALASSSALSRLPQHMFQKGAFSTAQRLGCYVYKGLLYGLIGCVNGGAGTALVHGLTAAREKLDPSYVPPSTMNPIGKSALLWTAYLGVSSNTRYQLVNGLEQVLYSVFSSHLGVARAATVAMRLGNNFLGSLNYVWLTKKANLAVARPPRRALAP